MKKNQRINPTTCLKNNLIMFLNISLTIYIYVSEEELQAQVDYGFDKESQSDDQFDYTLRPSHDDRLMGISYEHFDKVISDVGKKELEEIGLDKCIEHLSIGTFPESPFPVKGQVHGLNLRLMVPLVCRYNNYKDNHKARPHNVWFLVDSTSPFTCLSRKSLESLVGQRLDSDLYYFAIQIPSTNIECYLSKGNFSEVNLLGMNAIRRLRLSININWDRETFELNQK